MCVCVVNRRVFGSIKNHVRYVRSIALLYRENIQQHMLYERLHPSIHKSRLLVLGRHVFGGGGGWWNDGCGCLNATRMDRRLSIDRRIESDAHDNIIARILHKHDVKHAYVYGVHSSALQLKRNNVMFESIDRKPL